MPRSATPATTTDLGIDAIRVGLVSTAYLMTIAAVVPIGGWLSDRFGGAGFC